jgi:demethylmenaquinone methyltransferase/2-methoxy-6-polyprenyl-1,4-benzoquinol methylase
MEKRYVRSLFDSIAHRYDLLNHLLSGGIDFYWRARAIRLLREGQPRSILDVATGTADFAIASLTLKPSEVVGVDISEEMLKRGRLKIHQRGLEKHITLQLAEAEHLPFDSGRFDATIVAFGARNFENLEAGLAEMHRVLRPGGTIVVLEFSRPRHFPVKQLYFFYFRRVLPLIGKLISRSESAYTYLPDTVMKFPDGTEFLSILEKVGFKGTQETRLTGGIATLYEGRKS